MSGMADAIGSMVARQQQEWKERQCRRGNGRRPQSPPPDGGKADTWLDINPEAAVPIPDVQSPRRIAYVDGGNSTLLGSPGWSVGLNRVSYTVWQGEKVVHPRHAQRVDFLSLLTAEPGGGGGNGASESDMSTLSQSRRYVLRTFPVGGIDADGVGGAGEGWQPPRLDEHCIPTDEDMGNAGGDGDAGVGQDSRNNSDEEDDEDNDDEVDDDEDKDGGTTHAHAAAPDTSRPATEHNRSRMMSVPRAFAEWKMATAVVQKELGEGDIIVRDGTLQTGYGGEARLADALYDNARRRGVIVCSLAKTTTLMTREGLPVLHTAQEAARAAGHHTWYMPLARRVSGDGSGFVLAVRLHRMSKFAFRLEILRDQYDQLVDAGTLGEVIGSIAANSGDPSFPGYPYGLVSADRYARVRGTEAAMHRRMMLGALERHKEHGRTMIDHTMLLSAHKTLNRAVGG